MKHFLYIYLYCGIIKIHGGSISRYPSSLIHPKLLLKWSFYFLYIQVHQQNFILRIGHKPLKNSQSTKIGHYDLNESIVHMLHIHLHVPVSLVYTTFYNFFQRNKMNDVFQTSAPFLLIRRHVFN